MVTQQKIKREYPRLPRAIRAELMRQVSIVGVGTLAKQIGVSTSTVYRFLADGHATARKSIISKLESFFLPNLGNNGTPLRQVVDRLAEVQSGEFTLRIILGTKRAERLIAHCDLQGVTMSQFVGKLIDESLDEIWGSE